MLLNTLLFKHHVLSVNRKLQVFNILAAIYFLLRSKLKDIIQTRFLH